MRYLYGDSSPSSLQQNYIELLRDAVQFSVEVLAASHRVERWRNTGMARGQTAKTEEERLVRLGHTVVEALGNVVDEPRETPTKVCARAIAAATQQAVRTHTRTLKAALADDLSRIDAEVRKERGIMMQALENLLIRQDLPASIGQIELQQKTPTAYQASLRAKTPLGLTSLLELDIPSEHLFAQPFRVERIVDKLEVDTPEETGWLRKRVKLVTQRLTRHYVTGVVVGPDMTSVGLRAGLEPEEPGFDIRFPKSGLPEMIRLDKDSGDAPVPAYRPEPDDASQLRAFATLVVETLAPLSEHRKALRDATLDGRPFRDHPKPRELVERLVAHLAPVVQDIAAHSPVSGELSLKRVLADGRREELFVSKAELRERVMGLPPSLQSVFVPLDLGERDGAGTAPDKKTPEADVEASTHDEGGTLSSGPGGDEEEPTRLGKVRVPKKTLPLGNGGLRVPVPTVPTAGASPAARPAAQGQGEVYVDLEMPGGESGDAIPIEDDWLEKVSRVESLDRLKQLSDKALEEAKRTTEDSVASLLKELEAEVDEVDLESE